ncbi:DUF550 domain-containing protein [Klebsiella michiganensis]|uniref:DUF550 domain-containing protein n=1 Tax=Klebsiella michiganensis TaxID=1134687 RepID=UPI001E424120|nr:DUF550 domain-containing protein [Klebsiella michiganensis]
MTKSTITRERLEEIVSDPMINHGSEFAMMARMALAAMESEPVAWINGCNKSTPAALRYLAENPRPIGGESSFNSAHLYQLAREIELMSEAPLYRHAQQPVVPPEQHWEELCREHPDMSIGDAIIRAAWWNHCRAAMLQAGALTNEGTIQAGNSPVIPDGYVMVPMRLTAENGAKGALSGEFSETKFVNCPECFGDDECETCDGSGRIEITVPVTWTTIKEIWVKGVEHFAAAPQEVKGE